MSIPDAVRRWIIRTVLRGDDRSPVALVDQRPVDAFHDKLFDGDAAACAYFKRNPGRWS